MSDLRALPELLALEGAVRTPPATTIMRRAHGIRTRRTGLAAVLLVAAVAAAGSVGSDAEESRVRVGDGSTTTSITTDPGASSSPPDSSTADASGSSPGASSGAGGHAHAAPPTPGPPPSPACRAGANGGATAPGVTATSIKLIAGALLDGPTKTMTEDAPKAWKAVLDPVNKAGGICGRLIDMTVVHNLFGKAPDLGAEPYVGMLVGPFDNHFGDRIGDGSVDRWGIPAVVSDGASKAHFLSSWSWPVGISASAVTRIAVDEAYLVAGARTFALVHDGTGSWGQEAAAAFSQYVTTLPGAEVRVVKALDPADPSYNTKANEFNSRCGGQMCDATVLALLPETAKKWWQAGPAAATKRTSATQLLFSDWAGQDCARLVGNACDGLLVWTGFTPPIPPFDDPDVAEYHAAMDGSRNAGTTGAYVAAKALVAALRHAGPTLTRATLRRALDDLTFTSGLVSRLDWGPRLPVERAANSSALAIRMEVTGAAFRGWKDAGTGWVRDPMPGHFPE